MIGQANIYLNENEDLNTAIQVMLDEGANPLELVRKGISAKSIYGKKFNGGLVFFIDINNDFKDFEGIVCSPQDLIYDSMKIETSWGCYETDIIGLNNIGFTNFEYINKKRSIEDLNDEKGLGARIGDGFKNTSLIISQCPKVNTAGKLCVSQGEDWFLPSRGSLFLMYQNLHQRGLGDFSKSNYWSSTELSANFAWMHNFKTNNPEESEDGGHKNDNQVKIRAAKFF